MRRLNFIVPFLLLLNSNILNAQSVQWVKKGISPGFENGNAITCDDSGNVYAAGQIEYTSIFDNHAVTSYGSHDIVVVKYDNNGTLKWIHSAGGPGGDVGNGIGIDAAHNTYVAGEAEQTVNFGSGITVISAGANDIFLAKYNIGGNIVWAKRWGNSGNDKALSVAVSPSGDCFVTGFFSASVSFGGTQLTSSGGRDIFIAKINSSGSVLWAKKAGGGGEDKAESITLDQSGNIYIAGSFTQSATFGSITITNSGNNSAFVAKYNSNGNVQWAKKAGACCDTTQYRSVSVDENGNVYVAGYFNATASFGSNNFTSSGSSDVVVVKYSSGGNLLWAKQAGGIDEDIAYGLNIDTVNHIVYVTGNVSAAGRFDLFNYTISGFKDIFVVAYDQSGNVLWEKINGGGHRDIGSAITNDKQGYIYTTGLFNGTAYFDTYTITGYPNQPWADFYVDKISALPAPTPATPASNLSITQGTCTDLDVSFTPGNGSARIVIIHTASAVSASPVNGNIYNADPVFGNGTDLGNSNYIVYNGTGNNVTVTGLAPGFTYYFSVIEYNGTGASNNYGNSSALTGSVTTVNYTITIAGLQNSICIGDSLMLHASGASAYAWSPSSGLSSTSGPSVTAMPQSTTSYTVNADTAGCLVTTNFTINVNPLPVVHFPNLNDVCANDPSFFLTTGTPAGGTYNGQGVRGGQFDPGTTGAGTFTLLYIYTDTNGCTSNNTASILVKSLPSITLSPVSAVCLNDAPVNLQGNPPGGFYFGTGVSSGTFDPSVGTGTYLISYIYMGRNGCSDTVSVSAIVNELPIINLGADTIVCATNAVLINAGTSFTSYLWSDGSTTFSVNIDSNGTGLGVKMVYVEVSNAAGCFNSDTVLITFDLCAGITDHGMLAHLNIFPNPFQSEVTFNVDETYSYFIYDVCGRLLDKGEHLKGKISTGNNLLPGIYLIEVDEGKYKEIFTLVKSE